MLPVLKAELPQCYQTEISGAVSVLGPCRVTAWASHGSGQGKRDGETPDFPVQAGYGTGLRSGWCGGRSGSGWEKTRVKMERRQWQESQRQLGEIFWEGEGSSFCLSDG